MEGGPVSPLLGFVEYFQLQHPRPALEWSVVTLPSVNYIWSKLPNFNDLTRTGV